MRTLNRGVVAVVLFVSSISMVQASVFIFSSQSSPSVGVPGYTTTRLAAQTDEGVIVGFNFSGTDPWGRDAGFIGTLNQVVIPPVAPDSTVFQDYNAFFSLFGQDVSADSQFWFPSTHIIVENASEERNHLQATFHAPPGSDFGSTREFAQIATPSEERLIRYSGSIDVRRPNGAIESHPVSSSLLLIPVPGGWFEVDSVPTVGLPGYTTHTIVARTESWNQIVGADLVLSGGRGVFGPMNQVEADSQPILTGDQGSAVERSLDSHFLLTPADANFGSLSESANSLQGFFDLMGSAFDDASDVLPIAQIVAPNLASEQIEISGYLKVLGNPGPPINGFPEPYQDAVVFVSSTIQLVPEPPCVAMMMLVSIVLAYRFRWTSR